MSRKVVGQAVATAAGYYPDDGVHCRLIPEGETFNVVEGLESASWFKRVDVHAQPAGAPRPVRGRKADVEREREQVKAESTPPADDIA